jgi:ketosteroid isomerase-like protein
MLYDSCAPNTRSVRVAMEPIWERRRKNKAKIEIGKYEFHSTDESGLFLAVFDFKAVLTTNEESISSPYIQLLRILDELITEVRVYFEP